MSSKEISQSAILLLKAKALESYGIIKNKLQQPPNEGVADEIATLAMRLVQFEGAALTLQSYFGDGVPVAAVPAEEQPKEGPTESPPPPPEQDVLVVTEEMSPTYKRAVQKEKIKSTARKRNAKSNKK